MNGIIFKNKKLNPNKLKKFGFIDNKGSFLYKRKLLNNEFMLEVKMFKDGSIKTKLVELSTNEIYTLHLVESASGDFVGKIKEEYSNIIKEIEEKCFDRDVFKCLQTKRIIEYVKKSYGDYLEFLWEKTPDAAIWRRKDSKKWYGIIMCVPKNKLIKNAKGNAEIMNVKLSCSDIEKFVDSKNYFPAYHMNKKYWLSIILDDRLSDEDIFSKINSSYALASNKKSR